MNYEKILEITNDSKVELAQSFKEVIHKELCLGMTRYVCRYGALGDGFEVLTDAQRYYQAVKEMWSRSSTMVEFRAQAMEAQADLMDAEFYLKNEPQEAERLRYEAKKIRAEQSLINALVQAEDTLRQMDEFNKVRLELKDKVQAQYPEGIEQAEKDHWQTVAQFRQMSGNPHMNNIPMPFEEKARLGIEFNRRDMAAALIVSDARKAKEIKGITNV
jgi:hypothetical protein